MSVDRLRHALYELCVQSPTHVAGFLHAAHGGEPAVLGEDFAGTAALSRVWCAARPGRRAVAVDLDAGALAYGNEAAGVTKIAADVMACDEPADVVWVGNFSIGYWHTRAALVAYLRHVLGRLRRGRAGGEGEEGSRRVGSVSRPTPDGGSESRPTQNDRPARGLFVCDTYGGESAFATGVVHRDHWIAGDGLPAALEPHRGKRVRYTWEQRDADPTTGMVTDVLHFMIIDADGTIDDELDEAFVYRWRLWSVPELRDAMLEAGFASTEVYDKAADAVDDTGTVYVRPLSDGSELEESFIVMVAGRV